MVSRVASEPAPSPAIRLRPRHLRQPGRRRGVGGLLGACGCLALLGAGCARPPDNLARHFSGRPAPQLGATGVGAERVNFAATGNPEGPLVLLIHGTPGDRHSLVAVLADASLAARATLLSVDRLGWGRSGDGSPVASVERQAEALRGLLAAHPGTPSAVVVGHSYGGAVAAWLATAEPTRVGALVLVAPSIDPAEERTMWYQAVSRWRIVRWLVPRSLRQADAEVKPLPAQLTELGTRVATLRAPVFVVHGQDDRLVPVANADYARRVFQQSPPVVEILPAQGHFIPWENPGRIVAAVHRALDAVGASRWPSATAVHSTAHSHQP